MERRPHEATEPERQRGRLELGAPYSHYRF